MSVWGILVAGGRGRRFGGEVPKQFGKVGGRLLIAHTLDALSAFEGLAGISLVVPEDHRDWVCDEILPGLPLQEKIRLVVGGRERADSVLAGLETVPDGIETVFVHDAVRPCVSRDLIARLQEASRGAGAVIPALKPADTVKEVDGEGRVVRTLDRDRLVLVQTPQVFRREVLRDAFRKAQSTMNLGAHTDCASLVEATGHPVLVVPGDPENIKVTTPRDQALVDGWLEGAIRGTVRTADVRGVP